MTTNLSLKDIRVEIDSIDQQLIFLLGERVQLVKQVGQYKKMHQLPPLDEKRWQAVVETRRRWGRKVGLAAAFIKQIWNVIHQHALELEHEQ